MGDFINKIKQMWNTPDDEYDYDDKSEEQESTKSDASITEDYYSEEPSLSKSFSPQTPFTSAPSVPSAPPANIDYNFDPNPNKVMNIDATTKLQVVVFRPDRFSDETRTIADELIRGHTVVLNLEGCGKDNSRRIIDFMSGAAYATGGKIKRVATSTFLVIPNSVHMTGDDLLAQLQSNGVVI